MGQTMTAKILAKASSKPHVDVGEVVLAKIAIMTCLDGTTFIDSFNQHDLKLWDPQKVIFCFDHNFQPEWLPQVAWKEHPKIRKFAKHQGIPAENVYDIGRNDISHQIPVEKGWALPGTVCIGSDTQSATMGATNCFALPVMYGADPILLTGDIWMIVPECVRVNLSGTLRKGVNGKDIVYRLIQHLGAQRQRPGNRIFWSGRGNTTNGCAAGGCQRRGANWCTNDHLPCRRDA